jgi:AraC-like DNA-binding protein
MEDRLRSGVAVIDSSIMALNNAMLLARKDPVFRILKYRPQDRPVSPYGLLKMQDSFNSIILSHPLIADTGFVFSDDVVITRRGIFYYPAQYAAFYGIFFQCGDLSMDEWKELMPENRSLIPVQTYTSLDYGTYDAITYTTGRADIDFSGDVLLYATIPVNDIVPLLVDKEIAARGYIRIFNESAGTLLAIGNENRDDIYTLSCASTVNPIIFELGIPRSFIQERLRPVTNLILFFILITALLIFVLSLLFAFQVSRPMRDFFISIDSTKIVRAEYEGYEKNAGYNPFKTIRGLYSALAKSIMAVDAKLDDSLQIIEYQAGQLKTRFFNMALQKGIYTPEDHEVFSGAFPDFPRQFQLALIRCEMPEKISFQETLAFQVRILTIVKNEMNNIHVQGNDVNTIVMLLPYSEGEASWYRRLEVLRETLNRQIALSLSIFLSDVFNKVSDLTRAWQQLQFMQMFLGVDSLTGVEQMSLVRQNSADLWSGDSSQKIHLPLNIAMTEIMYSALCGGDDVTACTILKECAESLAEMKDPFVFEHVSSMLSTMITQLKLENPSILFNVSVPVYIHGKSDEIFGEIFPACFRQICQYIKAHKEKNINKFGREILEFIDRHLYDPQLYIAMVLDRFNISQPTLQKIVKNLSGQTFFSYVEKHRLNKAYDMLLNEQRSIKEVAGECGFSNTNSFYKAFKHHYGFSPNQIKNGR